jgi:Predicted membrane-bound metal-dependent hydrolase (DUF457).
MPSTLVHIAVAGLLGTALLGAAFDRRAILTVMAVAAIPDLDTLLGLWLPGAHRAYLHTLVLPAVLGGVLWWDVAIRSESTLRRRWGDTGVRVAWVSLFGMVVAHSLYDGVVNGVNLLWPLQDRFYDLSGYLLYSTQSGLIQTFVDASMFEGTTATTHYYTGVDPSRGSEPEDIERIFHLVQSGERLLLMLVGFGVVILRLWRDDEE